MRYYTFSNMYLSSLQVGLQSAHALAEIFLKHYGDPILMEWANDHKTMILLNAGYGENIHSLCNFFNHSENPFPWAPFYESEEALDGAITTVGIVLPAKIYEMAAMIRDRNLPEANLDTLKVTGEWKEAGWYFSKWEVQLIEKLNTFGMAS